jgi:hypothetical protein
MKRTQLVVLSVLTFGLAGFAHADPYPADAEASYDKPALDSYADQHARAGDTWGVNARSGGNVFPADAEASYDKPALGSFAEEIHPSKSREMRDPDSTPFAVNIADG